MGSQGLNRLSMAVNAAVPAVAANGVGKRVVGSIVRVEEPLPVAPTPCPGAASGENRSAVPESPPKALQELTRPQEIAKWLKCSPRTVIRMADRGEFPKYVSVGDRKRFVFAEVEAWLAQRLGERK